MADAHADLTNRLLDVAADVFGERGYDGARVSEIARRAGVTTGAIYSRYSGKAELLLEAIDAKLPSEMTAFLTGGLDTPAVETLALLGAHLVDPLPCSPLFLEALVASRRDPELAERMRRRWDDEDQRLGKLFEEAKADGLVDTGLDTDALVRFAHAIGMGMNVARALGVPLPTATAWTQVIERVIAAAAPSFSTTATPPHPQGDPS